MSIQDTYFDLNSDIVEKFGEYSDQARAFEVFSTWAFKLEAELEEVTRSHSNLKNAIKIIKEI